MFLGIMRQPSVSTNGTKFYKLHKIARTVDPSKPEASKTGMKFQRGTLLHVSNIFLVSRKELKKITAA